jgi:hypothetical protein
MNCPYCEAKAVDITTNKMSRRRYFCVGPDAHEFDEGDLPQPVPEPEPEPDGVVAKIKRFFA